MPNGMKDKMSMGEGLLKAALKCACCGEFVESGKSHECKKEEVNEGHEGSSDQDAA